MARRKFEFNPSAVHDHLIKTTPREMAFDGGDVKAWQRKLRKKVKSLTGFDRMPSGDDRCDLNVQSIWKREHKLGSIERITFTSEDHADVPAYVCLPKNAEAPYEWFVCVQGHSTGMHNSIGTDFETNTKNIKVPPDRDFGLTAMANGYAALCIEQRGFGERHWKWGKKEIIGSDDQAAMHALMLGRTLIAERVFDVDRGIDYLMTRDDVQPKRIGVMGNSGGGTISMFSSAMLPRLATAMPSCYFCSFEHSVMAMPHCGCNFVPGILTVAEMSDVMGLFAPKPLVIVAGKHDDIFPIHAVRSQFRLLQKIYAAAGAPDNCKLVVGDGDHRFYADLSWPKMNKLFGHKV